MKNPAMKKILTAGTAIFVMSFQITAAFASFSDVPSTYGQFNAIDTLTNEKVLNGYSDGTFKPDQLVTRGEFLKMVFNDVGYQPAAIIQKTPFIDVPSGNWTAPYVQKALDINAISANGPQPTFTPARPINRADAIKIAFTIEGIPAPYYTDIDPQELFEDVQPTSWYAYLARAAKLNGIISSKHPELFWATHLMTRGDAAELIYQIESARQDSESGSTSSPAIITPDGSTQENISSQFLNNPRFSILLDVWQKLNTEYYNKAKVNQDDLIYGAIDGMVSKLGDQFTVFEDPTDAAALQQYLQGEFDGVGIYLEISNGKIIIHKTVPGSPAEKANLQPGDVSTKINDQTVDSMTVDKATDLIKGASGTTVNLTILRGTQTITVTLTRTKITFSSVDGNMMGADAYISIGEFTQSTSDDFTTTLNTLNKQSPKAYIIDLRGNPGGYLDSAVAILGHFVAKGTTVVSTKTPDGTISPDPSDGPGELKGKPVVVLIDADSASAAEIMAGALQDLKIAKLVGDKSYGKGSVQEISDYSDNSLLKITIAHWLTPNGHDINGIGLTPDVAIPLDTDQFAKGTDTQLNKAVDVLNGQSS
jgi:carboxyl-terminal processing protease